MKFYFSDRRLGLELEKFHNTYPNRGQTRDSAPIICQDN